MPTDITAGKRAVVFDLFFTLVTTEIDAGLPPTHAALGVDKAAWRAQVFSNYHARVTGGETDPYRILRALARAIDPAIPDAVIRTAAEQRIARFARILSDVPKTTLHVLRQLRARGLKTALISNCDAIETQAWERSPLAPLFDVVALSWQVGLAKPDAAIYRHCLARLDVPATQAVFVGDGGSDELSGGQAVGMTSVFATGLMPALPRDEIAKRAAAADHTIDSLDRLLP